jgi:hypothetical protein
LLNGSEKSLNNALKMLNIPLEISGLKVNFIKPKSLEYVPLKTALEQSRQNG